MAIRMQVAFVHGPIMILACVSLLLLEVFCALVRADDPNKALIIASKAFGYYEFSFISNQFPDIYQAYWAGFLETNITYDLTRAHFTNTAKGLCEEPLTADCVKLKQWLSDNIDYMLENFIYRGFGDEFWYHVGLQLWQLKGMSDAYHKRFVRNSSVLTHAYPKGLKDDVFGIYIMQLNGDLDELLTALRLDNVYKDPIKKVTRQDDHPSCSALIKLVPEDIFISHVTWTNYKTMLRVLKVYRFPWKIRNGDGRRIPGEAISFSSYPSVTSSIDDFYITAAKLVTLETTIGNDNDALWIFVREGARSSVLSFFRAMIANRLARTGVEWARYFRQENSGTYFPVVSNLSGIPEKMARFGDHYDYNKNARAKMFQRDHQKVKDLQTMHDLMRYNNYKEDPLSRCNCTPPYSADLAIASRSDLNDPNGSYPLHNLGFRLHGASDAKITNMAMLETLDFLATSGPPYTSVPAFQWSKLPIHYDNPEMQPDLWKFQPCLTNFTGPVQAYRAKRLIAPSLKPTF
ncbi:unnamed protein product [Echinostoma caproni]|uniref:Phospholipase B-like n=1 Tax=Echinostoma caproni TaxID=27848 RepID=A0A183A684_9TREM|nr:unnamed protein product [Echinostoma caproni]